MVRNQTTYYPITITRTTSNVCLWERVNMCISINVTVFVNIDARRAAFKI